jgi:hypothetical protein
MIPATLDNATQGELQRYKNNYKSLNLITTALGRNVYDRVAHLELFMMFGSSCAILMRALLRLSLHIEILITGSIRLFLGNLVNRFARFESIISSLRSCGPLAYFDNECLRHDNYCFRGVR